MAKVAATPPPRSNRKDAPAGPTAADEAAAAAAMTKLVNGAAPGRHPLQQDVPPVTAQPIVVEHKAKWEAPRDVTDRPRLKKVIFREDFLFDHASPAIRFVDFSLSENGGFYAGLYRRLELCTFMGEKAVLIERKCAGANGPEFVVFRIPWTSVAGFTTYDDNPDQKAPVITVNEQAKAVGP